MTKVTQWIENKLREVVKVSHQYCFIVRHRVVIIMALNVFDKFTLMLLLQTGSNFVCFQGTNFGSQNQVYMCTSLIVITSLIFFIIYLYIFPLQKKLVLPEMEDVCIKVLNSGLPEDVQKVLVTKDDDKKQSSYIYDLSVFLSQA